MFDVQRWTFAVRCWTFRVQRSAGRQEARRAESEMSRKRRKQEGGKRIAVPWRLPAGAGVAALLRVGAAVGVDEGTR